MIRRRPPLPDLIISEEAARRRLGPHEPKLRGAVVAAWSRWREKHAPNVGRPTARGRAGLMHDLITEEVAKRFGDRLLPAAEGRTLLLLEGIVIRFKKLTRLRLPRNYPTPTALSFVKNEPVLGIPSLPRLTVGYQENAFGTEIDVLLVCLNGPRRVMWSYSVGTVAETIPLPLPSPPPVPTRYRGKPGAGKKQTSDQDNDT